MASGKTTVGKTLAEILNWPRAGFGDYVRAQLEQMGGDPSSRRDLQDLGQSLVDRDPDGFCRAVLQAVNFQAGGNLILDGVRHVDIYMRVGRLVAPSNTKLIYIAAEDRLVRQRMKSRGQADFELGQAESHRVEAEVRVSISEIADLEVDGAAPLEQLLLAILSTLTDAVEASTLAKAREKLST